MITPKRFFFTLVSNGEFTERLTLVADECDVELYSLNPESLPAPTDLIDAAGLLLEFSSFNPASSLLIDRCRQISPNISIIVILPSASSLEIGLFTRFGVSDCLEVSSDASRVFGALRTALLESAGRRSARLASNSEPWRKLLVGESSSLEQVTQVIQLVAARRSTVLITGETGTGKEMAARAIHMASDRSRKPFVCINCGAIPENLIEAELFGHVKGAFTGAIHNRIGRFEQASGGTLFLDEVADLPFDLQAKLLRVLQEREIQRLGSSETIKTDVRVIAATNADLLARVQLGTFREDLYYRLNVVPIHMPALRERTADISPLVEHFLQKVCSAEGLTEKRVAPEAIFSLCSYSWPGNVRQLENMVEHAVVMSGDRPCLYPSDFPLPKTGRSEQHGSIHRVQTQQAVPDEGIDFTETLRQFERALLHQALSKAQGNKTLAADMLRLPRTTLLHKLRVLEPTVAA